MGTTPATVALRGELDVAIALLLPQIRGLDDLLLLPLADTTRVSVSHEQVDHTRRLDLCRGVLAALTDLEADDYPTMPKAEVPALSFQELQDQYAAITAALAEFEAAPPASNISIELGAASSKPE